MSGAEASKWFRLDGVLAFFSSTQNLRHVIHQVWFCNSFAQYFFTIEYRLDIKCSVSSEPGTVSIFILESVRKKPESFQKKGWRLSSQGGI